MTPSQGLGGVAREGIVNLAGAAFAGLAGVALTWLVVHGLGPAHAGAFFTATAAFVLAGGIAKLGAPTSLVYWPARLRARGQPHLLGACLRIGLPPVAIAGLLLGAVLWLAAPWLDALTAGTEPTSAGAGQTAGNGARQTAEKATERATGRAGAQATERATGQAAGRAGAQATERATGQAAGHAGAQATGPVDGPAVAAGPAERHGDVAAQLRVLALFLPVAVLTDALLSASRGYRTMRPTVMLDRITRPALQLAGVGGLALAAGWMAVPVTAYPLAWAGPFVPVAVLAAYQLRLVHAAAVPGAAAAPTRHRRAALRRLRRNFWRFAAPRALATVGQLGLQRVDVLLVAVLAGLSSAALYAVAGRFMVLGQFANQGISQAVQPRLAETLATGDRAGASALYQAATGWLVLITWPLYLMMIAFAPLYLGLFGGAYATGGQIVAILSAAMLLATGCGMVDMVLAMGGRTSWNLVNVALALAVTVAVDLTLIPRLGALGAAIGLAAAVAVNNLLPLTQIGYVLRVHPFGRGTLTAAALAWACFGALPLVAVAVAGVGPAALLASLLLGGCGYVAGAFALRRPLALDALTALRRPTTGGAGTPGRAGTARRDSTAGAAAPHGGRRTWQGEVTVRTDHYTRVFQDTAAVEKYEHVVYAPDSYASAINQRQQAFLRGLVRRTFPYRRPVQHDFACGTGRAIRLLHGLVRAAHGYDTSPAMLAKAGEVGAYAELHQIDADGPMPAPVGTDGPTIVTVFRLLLNVDDTVRERAIAFAAQALPHRDSGLLLVENHGNRHSLRHLRHRRKADRQWYAELSHNEVAALLARHGFCVVRLRGFAMFPQGWYERRWLAPVTRLVDNVCGRTGWLSRYAVTVLYVARRDSPDPSAPPATPPSAPPAAVRPDAAS